MNTFTDFIACAEHLIEEGKYIFYFYNIINYIKDILHHLN